MRLRSPVLATLTSLAIAIATTLPAASASADDGQTEARTLFDEGIALLNAGRTGEACVKLERSLKAFPGLGTRGKLAECYEKQGRFASAWASYKAVAELAGKAGDTTRESVANDRARALEPKLSYLKITVPPSSALPGLLVKRGGVEMARDKLGVSEPVDPGLAAFEISAPGRRTMTMQINVGVGQSTQLEIPVLEADAPKPVAPKPAEPQGARVTPEPGADDNATAGSWHRPVAVTLGAVGLAGLVVGSIFGVSAGSTYDDAFDSGDCDRATKDCNATGQSTVDDARSKATLSTIFFVAGAAFAVGGGLLYFMAPEPSRGRTSASSASIRLTPVALPSGGGLVFGGRL